MRLITLLFTTIILLFGCKENIKTKTSDNTNYRLIRDNLYVNESGDLFLKGTNTHPLLEGNEAIDVYLNHIYCDTFHFDSIYTLNDFVDTATFRYDDRYSHPRNEYYRDTTSRYHFNIMADGGTINLIFDNPRDLPNSELPLVLRTDFIDRFAWKEIKEEILSQDTEFNFRPMVQFLVEKEYENIKPLEFKHMTSSYEHYFIFLVDSISITNPEHPVQCIRLDEGTFDSFRVIPSQMWAVENNLSISNMDFEDFLNSLDDDGVFRGF